MKKRASTKRIHTIEELATLFVDEMSAFREEVNNRFDAMDKRFDTIEAQLASLEIRVAALEMKVSGIQRRLDEEAMERVDVRALIARIAKLEERVFKHA